jgi:hypothetical protein
MYNNELIVDEPFSLTEYVKENFIGLLLMLLAFVIIYFVDHVARINAMIYAIPSPIPTILTNPNTNTKPKKVKK